jgi:MFS family permease
MAGWTGAHRSRRPLREANAGVWNWTGRARVSPETRRFAGFLLLVLLVGALSGPLRSLLPVRIEADLGRPPAFTSTLQALMLGGAGLFALLGGALADRLGQKRTYLLGIASPLLLGLVNVLQAPDALVPLAVVAGLADGLYSVGGQSYLVATAPRRSLGTASALYFLGSTLGASLGSLVAGPIVQAWGFASYGSFAIGTAALLIVVAARWLPSPAPPSAPSPTRGLVPRVTLTRDLLLVAALRFLPTYFWGTATLLTPLLLYRLSGSVVGVTVYSAVSLTVAAGCQIVTGRVLDRVGRGWPVLVLGVLLPLAPLGMALGVGSYRSLFVAGVFATSVAWSISVNFPPLVRAFAMPGEHGRALGLIHLLWVSGMLGGTLVAGRLVDADPALPFLLAAALNAPIPFVGIALWRRLGGASEDAGSEARRPVSDRSRG